MAIGYRSPWAFWRCPVCEGEGHLSAMHQAMVCLTCGKVDSTSEAFDLCRAEDGRRAHLARKEEKEAAERRRDEEARKVKISPKEWAE